jgi:hypothetical protein
LLQLQPVSGDGSRSPDRSILFASQPSRVAFVADPPLTQPAVTILTVKEPQSVTMLHVDRDKGTIAYKTGTTPDLVYSADKGWTVKNNTVLIVIVVVVVVVFSCCLMNM